MRGANGARQLRRLHETQLDDSGGSYRGGCGHPLFRHETPRRNLTPTRLDQIALDSTSVVGLIVSGIWKSLSDSHHPRLLSLLKNNAHIILVYALPRG